MNAPSYTTEPDYLALLARVRAESGDEAARLVLADWVQDHDDEAEARAIRARCSVRVDLLPHLERAAAGFVTVVGAVADALGHVLPVFATWTAAAAEEMRAALPGSNGATTECGERPRAGSGRPGLGEETTA